MDARSGLIVWGSFFGSMLFFLFVLVGSWQVWVACFIFYSFYWFYLARQLALQ